MIARMVAAALMSTPPELSAAIANVGRQLDAALVSAAGKMGL